MHPGMKRRNSLFKASSSCTGGAQEHLQICSLSLQGGQPGALRVNLGEIDHAHLAELGVGAIAHPGQFKAAGEERLAVAAARHPRIYDQGADDPASVAVAVVD